MGDWCEPGFRHRLIENRGAFAKVHQVTEMYEEEEDKSIHVGEILRVDTAFQ